MIIFPAVDMRQGRCVRLRQGRAKDETVYSEDPVVASQKWWKQGASWLHLVDLDGAMVTGKNNRLIAQRIFEVLPIPVQFGGGIRTFLDVEELIAAGAARVILGTAAVEKPALLEQALTSYPNQVVVGLDAQDGFLATRGWNRVESLEVLSFACDLAARGVERVIYTDISKDGMLKGPNLEGIKRLIDGSGLKVIASGGVSSLKDLADLKALESTGLDGVIIGKALYEERFSLREALDKGSR